MRLVELILNITYNRKTTSIEPHFWSGELFSRFGWPRYRDLRLEQKCLRVKMCTISYLVHGRFLAALDLLERRPLGSMATYGNPEGRCVRRCAPRRMGGSLPTVILRNTFPQ
jgi:hypothetical protein